MLRRLPLLLLVLAAAPAGASFVTFESGPVRPLALSPDTNRLYAVNTPDNRLEIFDVSGGGLVHLDSVPVGLEPVAVAARTNTEVWVVNHLSDSVSIVDVGATPPRVVRTLLVGDEPRDIVFAGTGGNRAFITTAHRGQNSGVPLADLTTPGIGRADVWVFNATALGADLGGTPITVVELFGDTPRALAVSTDVNKSTVYAAVFHSGNRTTTISEGAVCDGGPSAGTCSPFGVTFPGGLLRNTNCANQPQPETGLIVKYNPNTLAWEDKKTPTPRNWNNAVMFSLPDLDVFAIDANAAMPVETASWASVGTVIFNMIVNPADNTKVYVTNTEARNEVQFEGPGTCSSTVRGHLHEARITVLDGATVNPRHLNKHLDTAVSYPNPGAGEKDKSLATPVDMAITPDGATLYVAAFGSSKIGIFDTSDLENDTFVPSAANQIPVTGGGPGGLVLRGNRLYVATRFDDAIAVIDTTSNSEILGLHTPLHNPEPNSVVDGRPFLYDADFTSNNGEAACAACHVFGDFDSLAWDLGNPDDSTLNNPNPVEFNIGQDPDFRPLKGPMTTQSLRGMANHGPMHWRGDRTGGNDPGGQALDEDAAFKKFNVAFNGLLGRSGPLTGGEMQAFTDFILQVTYPPNPIRKLDNSLDTTPGTNQQAGHDLFFGRFSDVVRNCNGCHALNPSSGFFGSDGDTSFENEPQMVKIPHLRNLYQKIGMFGMPQVGFFKGGNNGPQGDQVRGFGFLHDGSTDTLFRFHNAQVFDLDPTEALNMEHFMFAFDSNLAPIVGQQVTLTNAPGSAAAVNASINRMIARAGFNECDLVVKGNLAGEPRGWWFTGGTFQSDRQGQTHNDVTLRGQASTAGQERTYTCVPPGSGERIGIDRDDDGFFDSDEIDAGSDPADPSSIPSGGSTTTTASTSTTTTTFDQPGPSKCTSRKLSLAGKKMLGRAKCHGKAVKTGTTVEQDCLDATTTRFHKGWVKAEAPGNDCLTLDDEGPVEGSIDQGVDFLVSFLRPSQTASICTSKKFSTAGKKGRGLTKCHAKALKKGVPVSSDCLQKAMDKFSATWSKAEAPGNDCQTTSDEGNIENLIDLFIDTIVNALVP